MAAPYTPQAISGYNPTPPADDGSQVVSNRMTWAGVKTELNDPIKTLAESINTAVGTAFGKVIGGVGVTSTAISYAVVAADQGKLVRATASGITITTPDATDVGAPFVFAINNNSSGTITLDGSGTQTIDGSLAATVAAGAGMIVFTDGSNWFTTGQQGVPVGKQMQTGDILNGTLAVSQGANAVTFTLQTLAGADPSAADPVVVCFRNATATTGNYVYRNIAVATSLTISAGSNLGISTNSQPFRVWVVLFDDGGTIRLGVIQCRSSTGIYPLGRYPIASATTETGGNGDSAQTFYANASVTSKPYVILGYCDYESGQSTAGNWSVGPDHIQLYGNGIPLPGHEVQLQENYTGAVATGATAIPSDDTIPTNSEGAQFMSQAITPVSAANVLHISHVGVYGNAGTGVAFGVILTQDSGAAIAAAHQSISGSADVYEFTIDYKMVAATTSSTTFKIKAGDAGGNSVTINGTGGNRRYGGVMSSYLRVSELQA